MTINPIAAGCIGVSKRVPMGTTVKMSAHQLNDQSIRREEHPETS
jgi:hypothetical protein